MKPWLVLFNKELLEMKRNFKLLWVPVVFLLLGVMQPVTTYFLPEILKASGDLPEGLVISAPSATDVMVKTLSNYGMIGLLVLALAVMGILSSERASGMTAMILVKPVSVVSYILSKWTAAILLTWAAYLLGVAGAWYYTLQLVGSITFSDFWQASFLYGIWLTVIVTVTLLASAWLRSGAAAAAVSLLFAAALSVVTSSLPRYMKWSPARLSSHAYSLLSDGRAGDGLGWSLAAALLLIVLLLAATVAVSRKKERV